jgi:hypothetical protein
MGHLHLSVDVAGRIGTHHARVECSSLDAAFTSPFLALKYRTRVVSVMTAPVQVVNQDKIAVDARVLACLLLSSSKASFELSSA